MRMRFQDMQISSYTMIPSYIMQRQSRKLIVGQCFTTFTIMVIVYQSIWLVLQFTLDPHLDGSNLKQPNILTIIFKLQCKRSTNSITSFTKASSTIMMSNLKKIFFNNSFSTQKHRGICKINCNIQWFKAIFDTLYAFKNIFKATKKGIVALVESIMHIHEVLKCIFAKMNQKVPTQGKSL